MKTNNPLVKEIAKKAFPDYKGRKYRIETAKSVDVRSYWDGGSRDYFNFVRLDNLQVFGQVSAQSMFDKPIHGADRVELIPGLACVRHSYFCGKDSGLTVIVNAENEQKLLA